MPPGSTLPAEITDGAQLAKTREQFLTAEAVDPNQVRDAILASWWRSRRWNVAADRIDLPYLRDPDLDTPLTRSALPVLRHLREHLDGQPISIILTDPAGLVLTRMDAGRDLDAHLDRVNLSPGFSYAEEYVGTNGIGTALEGGRPMHVFGHEHYAENLEDLACAGVPIHHPISGKTVGAVDLTCWRKDADPLLLTLAKTTAGQIQQALLTDSGIRELELLQEYLRTCRRTAGIVFALNNDVVMMNDNARQVLDPAEQSVLLGPGGRDAGQPHTRPRRSWSSCPAASRRGCTAGRCAARAGWPAASCTSSSPSQRAAARRDGRPRRGCSCPGWSGRARCGCAVATRCESVYDAGEWLALEGEPGVGKLAVVRGVHQHRSPGRATSRCSTPPTPAGAAGSPTSAASCSTATAALVIQHVDRLGSRAAAGPVAAAAGGRAPAAPAAVGRGDPGPAPRRRRAGRAAAVLPEHGGAAAAAPPRRGRAGAGAASSCPGWSPDGRLACSPEAMQLLVRSSWPGNTEQLWQVLRRIVQHRRSGAILPGDLPPECRTVSRRLLSPLEAMERDAIVPQPDRLGRQQDQGGGVARHVAGDDLPQDSRVRDRHTEHVDRTPPLTRCHIETSAARGPA